MVFIVGENISRDQWHYRSCCSGPQGKGWPRTICSAEERPPDQAHFQPVFLEELFILCMSIELCRLCVTNVFGFCSQVVS